jgi:ribosome-associated heat shock protein Hsp15
MRLDLFLKLSRIAKTRSDAQRLCSAGLVAIGGVSAKASRSVTAGEVISVSAGESLKSYEILRVPEGKQVSKTQARELTREISS